VLLKVSSPAEPVKVRVDPSEFEQIVINLVVNACDAMEGEGQVDVTLTLVSAADRERGPGAGLTIADNGPGMPPDVLARCLEPFFTTKRRGQGSGLGMSTVYGLVTERGGHMDIDSDPTGTTVRIWLPLSEESPAAASEEGEVWPPGQTIAGRVLLVEDEPDLRLMAQQCLAGIGLEVMVAESAEFALFLLNKEGPFDALVTDIMLPGMSGVELADGIKRTHPRIPVLFMTGYAGSPTATSMPGPDANLLRKPYRPDTLRLRVAQMLHEVFQGSKR
jgi:CheY-like chemotaxis protein